MRYIYFITCIIFFTSCSTLRKNVSSKTTEQRNTAHTELTLTDSSKTDSVSVKTQTNTATITEDSSFENKTVVEETFTSTDTVPRLVSRKTTTISKGKKAKINQVIASSYDSSKLKTDQVATFKKVADTSSLTKTADKVKTVKRTSFLTWWWLLLIPLVGYAGIKIYKPGILTNVKKLFT